MRKGVLSAQTPLPFLLGFQSLSLQRANSMLRYYNQSLNRTDILGRHIGTFLFKLLVDRLTSGRLTQRYIYLQLATTQRSF